MKGLSVADVSFILTAYNHEAYIRKAVQGALAQDFEPLEIIISDDCSTDNTFSIIEEEVKLYQGPHHVRLNRNETNLGMDHNQKVALMARGKFLVMAHGDDISMPHRTRRLVEAWRKHSSSLISSNAILIDQNGNELGFLKATGDDCAIALEEIINDWDRTQLGATLSFEKEVYTAFPKITQARFSMGLDHILPFRGGLLNGVYYLHEPLIYYRRHDLNMSSRFIDRTQDSNIAKDGRLAILITLYVCMIEDLDYFASPNSDSDEFLDIKKKVKEKTIALCQELSAIRNELYRLGKRPTWIDSDVMNARPLNPQLAFRPENKIVEKSSFTLLLDKLRSTSLWRVVRRLRPGRAKN